MGDCCCYSGCWGGLGGVEVSRGHNFGGAKARQLRGAVRARLTVNLAQLVADGTAVMEAGASLGLTRGQTARAWATIKAGLGPQAC